MPYVPLFVLTVQSWAFLLIQGQHPITFGVSKLHEFWPHLLRVGSSIADESLTYVGTCYQASFCYTQSCWKKGAKKNDPHLLQWKKTVRTQSTSTYTSDTSCKDVDSLPFHHPNIGHYLYQWTSQPSSSSPLGLLRSPVSIEICAMMKFGWKIVYDIGELAIAVQLNAINMQLYIYTYIFVDRYEYVYIYIHR